MNDWGTPERGYPPERGAPTVDQPHVRLGRSRAAPEAAVLRRRARTSLTINIVLALFALGLLCIPGAVLAAMALSEARVDPVRSQRLLRWSWGLLAANLVFYVLLFFTVVAIAVYLFLAASR